MTPNGGGQLGNSMDNVDLQLTPDLLELNHIPLSAIGQTLLLMLKPLEDPTVHIVTINEVELLDNLQGLVELLHRRDCVSDWGMTGTDSIGAVLDTWSRQDQRASCSVLWQLLVSLGRFDLLRRIRRRLLADAELYLQRRQREQAQQLPTAPPAPERRFDVYVSYCEASHEDAVKAAEIVALLRERSFDVISAEDRLAGSFSLEDFHDIVNRCNRVLVLWSRAYQAETELRFELNHARSMDPAADRRRVIPVLLDDTPRPGHLIGIRAVRFGSRNYMQQLVNSLRDRNGPLS